MIETSRIKYPMNQWDKGSIRPGPVGSVGDVLTSVRIKQSMPDMPFAYSKTFGPGNDVLRGSNVQDGRWESFTDGGYGASVVKKQRLENSTGFKTATGWLVQNVVPEQRTTDPKVSSQGRQGFETQSAAILNRQGDMFGELPGGYKAPAGVLPRGGMMPRTVNPDNLPETLSDKRIDFVKPVDAKKPIPTVGGLLQSLVTNTLPTLPNNINTQKAMIDPNFRSWFEGLQRSVVGGGVGPVVSNNSNMQVDRQGSDMPVDRRRRSG